MKKAAFLIVGILSIVLIAATACGGDDDEGPARRPTGTPSAPATVAPATPTDIPAPTDTVVPAAPTTAPTAATAAAGGDAGAGKAVFTKAGCAGCHTIQGISTGTIGPELTNVATNAGSRISGMSAEDYIRQSIEDPPAFLAEGFAPIMPPTIRDAMTDEEFEDLVAFLLTQK